MCNFRTPLKSAKGLAIKALKLILNLVPREAIYYVQASLQIHLLAHPI